MIDSFVRRIELAASGKSAVVTLADSSRLSADNVVLAGGVQSDALLRETLPDIAPLIPPMLSGCGVSVLVSEARTRRLDHVIRTPNRAFACGLHVVPREDCLYLGATNIISHKPHSLATISDLNFLLDCAIRQLHTNLATGRISSLQAGNRPIPVDGFPLIGRLPGTPILMLTGTYRDGFHQSPLLAKRLADTICDGDETSTPPEFAPVRRPIQAGDRKRIAMAAAEHMLASGFEADWRIPVKWSSRLREDLISKYRIAADELDDVFTPPLEVLAFSIENPWLKEKLKAYYSNYR